MAMTGSRLIALVLALGALGASSLHAQNVLELQKGAVKITADVEGKARVGTGIIVRLDGETAYKG